MNLTNKLYYPELTAYYSFNAIYPDQVLNLHVHQNYELFYLLSGNSSYHIEGTIYDLLPGDILLIGKNETHKAVGEAPLPPMKRIVVQFNEEDILDTPDGDIVSFLHQLIEEKNNLFPKAILTTILRHNHLKQILEVDDLHTKRLYLSTVLRNLSLNYDKIRKNPRAKGQPSEILTYINDNLLQGVTAAQVCQYFHISHPFLNSIIRQQTGASTGKYIAVKRLLYAQSALQEGIAPTYVCNAAGFNDYSAFYRAYRAFFGHSPSVDHNKK